MPKKFKDYIKELENKGYKCTHYSDNKSGNGLAYYETKTSVLKITYEWIKVADNNYIAGNIISIDDVTECYIN